MVSRGSPRIWHLFPWGSLRPKPVPPNSLSHFHLFAINWDKQSAVFCFSSNAWVFFHTSYCMSHERTMNPDHMKCKKLLSNPMHLFITLTLVGGLSKPWILVRWWRKVFRELDNHHLALARTECEEGILWQKWQRRYFFIQRLNGIFYEIPTFM